MTFLQKMLEKNAQIASKLRKKEVFVCDICFETVLKHKKQKIMKIARKMSQNFQT